MLKHSLQEEFINKIAQERTYRLDYFFYFAVFYGVITGIEHTQNGYNVMTTNIPAIFSALVLFVTASASAQEFHSSSSTELNEPAPAGEIGAWSITDDGMYLITAPSDATVRIWDFRRGEQGSVLTTRNERVDAIRALAGNRALALTERGDVLLIRPDNRRSETVAHDMAGLATSADGGFAAMIGRRSVDVYRVEGERLLLDSVLKIPGARAVALTLHGEEVAVVDGSGALRRMNRAGTIEADPIRLPAPATQIGFSVTDASLVARTIDGRLVVVPPCIRGSVRGGGNAAPGCAGAVEIADHVVSFELRRKKLLTLDDRPAPILLATDTRGNVFAWDTLDDDGRTPARALLFTLPGTKGVSFDYWRNSRFGSVFAFDYKPGFVRLMKLDGEKGPSTTVTLVSIRRRGWAMFDDSGHYDAGARTINEILRVQSFKRAPKDGFPLDRFDTTSACRRRDLLRSLPHGTATASSSSCAEEMTSNGTEITVGKAVLKSSGNYEVLIAVRRSGTGGGGSLSMPALFHQTRATSTAPDPAPCPAGTPVGTTCWRGMFEAIPGIRNNYYAQITLDGQSIESVSDGELDAPKRSKDSKPRLFVIYVSASKYQGKCADRAAAARMLCDLESTTKNRLAFADMVRRVNARDGVRPAIDIQQISDHGVNLQAWQEAVAHVNESARSGDAIWVIFDGHAVYEKGLAHKDGRKIGNDYYFLPSQAVYNVASYIGENADRMITGAAIANALSTIKPRYVMLTISTCDAGGASEKAPSAALDEDFSKTAPIGLLKLIAAEQGRQDYDEPTTLLGLAIESMEASIQKKEPISVQTLFNTAGAAFDLYQDGLVKSRKDFAKSNMSWLGEGADFTILQ
ncbi:MAG: hypothetical protein P0Y59_23340 [Candidatus Sphingomonas phytovorans]|nr:hypothetical protein [Sphingomonas sp.]WEJ99797.1 MAG: hypothetical protein P0Y59_23340 [Sphingomonas sp.]